MTEHTTVLPIESLRRRLEALPRVQLAHLPTPVDACPRLAAEFGGPSIWCKRDDCTGLAFGGNKTRQLEFVLGDALAQGVDVVVQGAASQSNHSRQLSTAAARLGIDCVLLPRRDALFDSGQGNQLIARFMATRYEPVDLDASIIEAKHRVADELRAQGRTPYIIGMGGQRALSLAAVAYVDAFVEMMQQLTEAGEETPTHLYTTSQGSTQAGLQLGAELLGVDVQVIGINPMNSSNEAYINPDGIRQLMIDAAELLGIHKYQPGPIVNSTDYVGAAYGQPSPGSLQALQIAARTEGLLLDPVYSGKGFAGLADHIRRGQLISSDRVVFLHTGGLPALFAYPDALERT